MTYQYWKKCDLCKRPIVSKKPLGFCVNCSAILLDQMNNPKRDIVAPTGYVGPARVVGQGWQGSRWTFFYDEARTLE